MTLTKAKLLEICKLRTEAVDVPTFGEKVYLRSRTEVQRARRIAAMLDGKGNLKQQTRDAQRLYQIIDQVVDEKGEPLFTEADLPALLETDSDKLDYLLAAIAVFNGDAEKNGSGGSSDTEKS